jgi:hypothetical protein
MRRLRFLYINLTRPQKEIKFFLFTSLKTFTNFTEAGVLQLSFYMFKVFKKPLVLSERGFESC